MIELRNGGAELDLLPEVGGAIARFAIDGRDVLRPTVSGIFDPLRTSSFPLVPFANRIANGRFDFRGQTVRLPRNFGEHPHVLHGQGWQGAWRVQSRSTNGVALAFDHAADAWPWDYDALQTFTLEPDSLRIALRLTNRSLLPMPASIGFHPYFMRTPETRIRAEVDGAWLSDDGIPTIKTGPSHFLDLAIGAKVAAAPFVDHCHFGWRGSATVEQPEFQRSILLTGSAELAFLHLYIPREADFFCVEPVSAMPDALNRGEPFDVTGQRVIAPAETFSAVMTIAIRAP
jgi:aldose 1-epimerase